MEADHHMVVALNISVLSQSKSYIQIDFFFCLPFVCVLALDIKMNEHCDVLLFLSFTVPGAETESMFSAILYKIDNVHVQVCWWWKMWCNLLMETVSKVGGLSKIFDWEVAISFIFIFFLMLALSVKLHIV